MKKTVLSLLLLICLCIVPMTVSCNNDDDSVIKDDSSAENESISGIQQEEITRRLDLDSYSNYFDIEITLVSQTSNIKYYRYYYSGKTINSLTPLTGANYIYMGNTYEVTTTITVNTKTKSPDYIFSDTYLQWKDIPLTASGYTRLYLDNKGAFTKTYMIWEDISSPAKNYSVSDFLQYVHGSVTYYKTVEN